MSSLKLEQEVPLADYSTLTPQAGFSGLECLVELRAEDAATGIQFRECLIDYTRCPNAQCIKKLL